MEKKVKVITAFDHSDGEDASFFVQAAVGKKGKIHVFRTGTVPFILIHTPKPAAEVYDKLKKMIIEGSVRLPSPDVADAMSVYMTHKPWGRPVVTKCKYRPPSTHKRVFKKGRRIKTIAALDKHLSSGGWIFWGYQKRAVHPGWVMSWQYQMVRNSLGRMWKAVRL